MSTKAIPDQYDALIPCAVVRDAAAAIQFYKDVFGATELMRMQYPDSSKVAHAEIKIRNHVFMLGDECPEQKIMAPPAGSTTYPPASVMIYVNDVDAVFQKAIAHGATPLMPITDMFWGDRYGKFMDPFGHAWGVATHKKDVSPEDCAAAMANWCKPKPEAQVA
jgi:PhnB protein